VFLSDNDALVCQVQSHGLYDSMCCRVMNYDDLLSICDNYVLVCEVERHGLYGRMRRPVIK
jgi:hypothetical protein